MRLHIGVGSTKQFFGPADGQVLGDVDKLTAAVITLTGIAFRILVRQRTTLGFHHPRAGIVLRRDQLDMSLLAFLFRLNGVPELVVKTGDLHITIKHGCAAPMCLAARKNGPLFYLTNG